ncbi:MAG: hypothetical protein WKG07_46065 [Hymenobacter sp.]
MRCPRSGDDGPVRTAAVSQIPGGGGPEARLSQAPRRPVAGAPGCRLDRADDRSEPSDHRRPGDHRSAHDQGARR